MSAGQYFGLQPVAYAVFDGAALTAAYVGEVLGWGAITDSGTGDYSLAVDADAGLPAGTTVGGTYIGCQAQQRALAAGSVVVPTITSATNVDLNSWDLATPSAVDCVMYLIIWRWPV